MTKWPTCSLDIDGFCNGRELAGMVQVESMTYFQDYKWYDELADGKLKEETSIHETDIREKDEKSRKNRQNQEQNGKAWKSQSQIKAKVQERQSQRSKSEPTSKNT
ncbi:hypothetical protein Tco_1365575 [Tanacetum coccineum]